MRTQGRTLSLTNSSSRTERTNDSLPSSDRDNNIQNCCILIYYTTINYPKKNRFQSVPIVALCLYNIQRENLVFKNSLCIYHPFPICFLFYLFFLSFKNNGIANHMMNIPLFHDQSSSIFQSVVELVLLPTGGPAVLPRGTCPGRPCVRPVPEQREIQWGQVTILSSLLF